MIQLGQPSAVTYYVNGRCPKCYWGWGGLLFASPADEEWACDQCNYREAWVGKYDRLFKEGAVTKETTPDGKPVRRALAKWDGNDKPYQDKVEQRKREILDKHAADNDGSIEVRGSALAALYIAARDEQEEAEARLYDKNLELEALSQLYAAQCESENVTSQTVTGLGSVRVQSEPYTKVTDKEAFRQWCIRKGLETSLVLPWQSANAIVKELLMAGEPEPDGVEATIKTKVVLTRVKDES